MGNCPRPLHIAAPACQLQHARIKMVDMPWMKAATAPFMPALLVCSFTTWTQTREAVTPASLESIPQQPDRLHEGQNGQYRRTPRPSTLSPGTDSCPAAVGFDLCGFAGEIRWRRSAASEPKIEIHLPATWSYHLVIHGVTFCSADRSTEALESGCDRSW